MTRLFAAFAALLSCALLAGCAHVPPAPGSPTRAQLEQLLADVTVVARRTHVPGYDRACTAGRGCVFGPAWTDDTDAPGGHNGCDTRDDVLTAQLREPTYRAGSHHCVVTAGTLLDPYTGHRIAFTKHNAGAVQIDHVYALAAAWDMGADRWPPDRRARFANDLAYNLLAVDGKANQDKSDRTPGDWLPPNAAYHCFYAGKFLSVAQQYQLPITRADQHTLARIAKTCG